MANQFPPAGGTGTGSAGGGISGPGSSIDGHIVAFDGIAGDKIKQVEDVVLRADSPTSDPEIVIESSAGTDILALSADFSSSLCGIASAFPLTIESFGANNLTLRATLGEIATDSSNLKVVGKVLTVDGVTSGVGKLSFKDSTNERGFIGYDVSSNSILVSSKNPGNTETVIKSDTAVLIEYDSGSGFIDLSNSSANGSDLQEIFVAQNRGTNSGAVFFYVGNRAPEGVVTAQPGSIYYRTDTTPKVYILVAASPGSVGWQELLHTGSGVTVAVMSRKLSSGSVGQIVAPSFQPILAYNVDDINSDTARLQSSATVDRIVVKQITDTVNGDIYRVSFSATYRAATNTTLTFRIVSISNGNPTSLYEFQTVNGTATQEHHASYSGIVRGPSTLSGVTGFRVEYKGNTTNSVVWDAAQLSIERLG